METSNQASIQLLLENLCKSIYKDVNASNSTIAHRGLKPSVQQTHDGSNNIPEKLLKKCKLRSFEILLKKSQQKTPDEGYSDIIDPIRELKFSQFEYNIYVGQMRPHFDAYGQIREKQQQKILRKYDLFQECCKFVDENDYFRGAQSDGYSILWLLTLLKNYSSMDLAMEYESNESYFSIEINAMPKFPTLKPKIFRLNWQPDSVLEGNPYCSSLRRLHSSFTSLQHNEQKSEYDECINKPASHSIKVVLDSIKKQKTSKTICYTGNKWEELGMHYEFDEENSDEKFSSLCEKRFCTESRLAALHLMAIRASRNSDFFEAKIVQKKEFVEHIKLLLIGIESESFVYDQQTMSFKAHEYLTVDGMMPNTIKHFISDFIECGTCYRRLKTLISSNIEGFKLKCDGFLFKALHVCLDKYLEMFRRTIITDSQGTITEISLRVSPLIRQIRALAKLLAIHPTDVNGAIPQGSEFLGYLYRQIIGVTQKDISFLLVFLLTECCGVYFRHFSSWIFHGIVDDPGHELFIEFNNYYVPRTKFFFDKAFVVKRQSVPGFLQGWEESILLCGKYSNLLKLYNPTHSLFTIKPPRISVCLSFTQLKEVEAECEKYCILAQSLCGRPFVIADLRRQRGEKLAKMAQVIQLKSRENIENWKIERDQKLAKKIEQKEKDRLILLQQIQENHEKRIVKRREELEADREYLRQRELVDLEMVERENLQRKKNIEYYAELADIIDAQRQRTESEIATLKEKLSVDYGNVITPQLANEEFADESDNDSVYFDAEKSPVSKASSETPISSTDPMPITENHFDLLNANAPSEEFISDRIRNKANVLTSQINLASNENESVIKIHTLNNQLTDRQKNKLKVLQQEYNFMDANANADTITVKSIASELTDLQKNRNRVLASEFGITEIIVSLPSEQNEATTEFERNKKLAHSHGHTFEQVEDINANKQTITSLSELELNRQRVLSEEFDLTPTKSTKSNDLTTIQNKLKASLSLDLDSVKTPNTKQLSPKPCQSDFFVSPMSTTSDDLLACSISDETDLKRNKDLKLNCETAKNEGINFEQFTADIDERPTPISALNTAGIERRREGFLFNSSSQPTFSHLLRPTFTTTNIFDLSPHLTSVQTAKPILPSPVNQTSKTLSVNDLQQLSSANLTHFLQQSFIVPLQVQSSILNNEILKIFFEELDILSHFNSLRNYFFMMDGEFACNISDGILNKLQSVKNPRELFNSHVLHSILENALQSSLMGNDKNAENLSFCIPNVPEKFEMASPNVLSELHLSYKVNWPLNLLISEEAIDHYDRVFQHLIKLRRITWLLEQCFYKLKDIRKQSAEQIQQSSQFRHIQHIRHKLLCFVNALQNHITSIALQGSWQIFQEDLNSVKSMQDLYRKHTKYLKRVKFLCMLNRSSQEFYTKMEDVFVVILRFCYNLQSKNWRCDDSGVYSHPKYEKLQLIENDFMNLIKFIIYAGKKMSRCGYQTEISEFIYMININGYYDDV